MPFTDRANAGVLRDLGNGLILRVATAADADALAEFNAEVHREPARSQPDEGVAAWTRELLLGKHPTVGPHDFTVVEETSTGAIVSSMVLLDQTWTYAGLPFLVGRPELVGTRPDYRNRGLIGAQFEVVHSWSARRGQPVQAITGIPYFYRQFGYEMAVNLGGGQAGFAAQAPALEPNEAESFRFRPAVAGDLPLVDRLYRQHCDRSLLACPRDEEMLRYEIDGKTEQNVERLAVCIVETAAGRPMGLLLHERKLEHKRPTLFLAEILPGDSWLDVAPGLLRYLVATGAAYAGRDHEECTGYALRLLPDHPLLRAVSRLAPLPLRAYAWYIRVPDLIGFLQQITPVLDRRLAVSAAAGHSGELTIGMYREGLQLRFEEGRIAGIEPWQPQPHAGGNVQFPGRTFLQLVFGHRTLDELRYAFPDCSADGDRSAALIDALFPKQASAIWPIS